MSRLSAGRYRSASTSSPSSFQRLSFMPSVLIPMPRATAVLARWPLNCWSVLRMTFFSISASGLPASSSTADDPPDARPPATAWPPSHGAIDAAHVHLHADAAADALERALLEHAQQLGLERRRDLADLVQQQRPAVGQLEAAAAHPVGAGEGALLVAEQLALQQVLRQGGAVD